MCLVFLAGSSLGCLRRSVKMTLGRTSSGAIKIKTDSAGGGLRSVECGCCGPIDPCQDCPPFNENLTFQVSGEYLPRQLQTFEYTPVSCCEPIRNCIYYFDAVGSDGAYFVSVTRSLIGDICGWTLSLGVQFIGIICGYPCGIILPYFGAKSILAGDPRGVHLVEVPDSAQCCGPNHFFTYTVTIT